MAKVHADCNPVNSIGPHKVITPYFLEIAAGYEDTFILAGRLFWTIKHA